MLKEVKDETSMRNKLRDLLSLLMRILAIASLVFAFAQPIFNKNGKKIELGKKVVSIYIDNSFSMQAKKQDVKLLDIAKKKASEIVQAYSSNDEFNILSNNLSPSQLRFLNKEQALASIDEISISPSRKSLDVIENKQRDILSSTELKGRSYILSDFQENITNFNAPIDTNLRSYLVPIQAVKENNVSIDSVWLIAPIPMVNETNHMMVRIHNYGNQAVQDLRLNLEQDGQTRPVSTYDIPSGESILDTIKVVVTKGGWQDLELSISDYPIHFDDKYKVTFEVKEKIDVLNIYQGFPNRQLEAAYYGAHTVNYKAVSHKKVDYGSINSMELIILSNLDKLSSGLINVLQDYVKSGGNLFIVPSVSINISSYNNLLNSLKIDRFAAIKNQKKETFYINTQEFIFNNVFLKKDKNIKMPSTSLSYTMINSSASPKESIIKYRDGSPFLSKYRYENGNIYLLQAPLDESVNSLSQNAEIFVPLMYKMAISKVAIDKLSQVVAQDKILKVNAIQEDEQHILKVRLKKGSDEFIPGQQMMGSTMIIDMNDQIEKPGFYLLEREHKVLSQWAYNYSRAESKLDYLSKEKLKSTYNGQYELLEAELGKNLTDTIKEGNDGMALWKWALILALVFLGLETLLLRMRKT